LIEEGLARELINRIQNIRKESGYEVTDRIELFFEGLSDQMRTAVENKADYIKHETLALHILLSKQGNLQFREITIGEESFKIGIRKNNKY
jgi:isoleucyl-tRNA synthetase